MRYYIDAVYSSIGAFQQVLSRLHGAGDRTGLERVFCFATKVSICVSVFIGVSLILWGKPFVSRWMGAKYEDAYPPMVALSLAVLLDVVQSPSINLLYATINHRFYAYANWAEGIINLLFSLALARPLGILGVALDTLIGALFVRVGVQPWWVCKAVGLDYGRYMRFLAKNLVRCGCLTGAAVAISAWGLKPSYSHLVTSAICAIAVYAAGSWFIVFSGSEREQLLAAIANRNQKGPGTWRRRGGTLSKVVSGTLFSSTRQCYGNLESLPLGLPGARFFRFGLQSTQPRSQVPVTLVRPCLPTRPCPGILDRAILVLRHRACPGMRLGICCRFTNLTALRVSAAPQTPAAACINRNMRRPEGGRRLQTWNHAVKDFRPAQPSAVGSFIAAPPPQAVPGEVL
jgi:Polysaccharide biosynthesis C-terminal domain